MASGRRTARYLAADLGAESGRLLLGSFDGSRVGLEEAHRFSNEPVELPDGLHWDVLRIFREVRQGLAQAAAGGQELESLAVDAWGVDFGLLDRNGALISNPYHHRDARNRGMVEKLTARVPASEVYRLTGIQFMQINTLCQLLALEGSPLLDAADSLLTIPDLICYWLTGETACEFTAATTTQLYDQRAGGWAPKLVEEAGLSEGMMPAVMEPGSQLGRLRPEHGQGTLQKNGVPVVAAAAHDTASAVVAVPARGESFAYISSGTWSLVGVELASPVICEEALEENFTNEGGFGGTVRFLKNVMGLWLVQECRRAWAWEGRYYSYEELTRLAGSVTGEVPLVDPDFGDFLEPGEMPRRVADFCAATGQRAPREPGEVVRCVLESLALRYGEVLERAVKLTGRDIETVHVVGGGSRNSLLCQLTADAAGRPVVAGPVEATALGNVMVQAFAAKRVGSLEEMREVVRGSVRTQTYRPLRKVRERETERFREVVRAGRGLANG